MNVIFVIKKNLAFQNKINEKVRKEESDADSGAESDNDFSSDEGKKSSVEDDDVEWEKYA